MEPTIVPTGQKSWENRHQTFTEDIDDLYDVWNGDDANLLGVYNASTKGIQTILATALADGKEVRSLGGGWSFTRIATTKGGRMVNTKNMNALFNVSKGALSDSYTGAADNLLFAQCGNSVQELNKFLKKKNQSLKTTGASNGQTIAGALSTGTHGSAFDFGAIPEYVLGLHIIVSPTRHVWLERSSAPVMSDDFPARLGAELLRDDEIFNAALVSFGAFGFIHGVLLETEDIYLLECHRQKLPIDAKLLALLNNLDFNAYDDLPYGHERPFHFQALINPYEKEQIAYITTMYKRSYHTDYTPPPIDSTGIGPGDDAPAFLGMLSQSLPAMVPLLVNKLIGSTYKEYSNVYGTVGEIFNNTDTRGKVLSAAIGVDATNTTKVIDIINQVNASDGPFAGVYAFRYVKQSTATLGFTCFGPVTCVIELDGVMSDHSYHFYQQLWAALEANDIAFTFHWGKVCEIDLIRLSHMYGSKLTRWNMARRALITDPACLKLFTNDQMTAWGWT